MTPGKASAKKRKIRYAVVGCGHFAQTAALPAFAHARKNSELVAIFSEDPEKRRQLARKYDLERAFSYEEYDEKLSGGDIDAVYIALPNSMHADFTVRAARAGVHVLSEKPMAVTERECEDMIRACSEHHVKLMIAYRLHFEPANLDAVKIAQSGKLGNLRFFHSHFSMQVEEGNIRVDAELGGGTLYDLGVYPINAARYLFREEPVEAIAFTGTRDEPRFREAEEMASCILRFPGDRLANFTLSFGAPSTDQYEVFGTRGSLRLVHAYSHVGEKTRHLMVGGKATEKTFPSLDQIAPEFLYFSDCILNDREPEPSGREGLADVRVVRALYESARTGQAVRLDGFGKSEYASEEMRMQQPPVEKTEAVHVEGPHG